MSNENESAAHKRPRGRPPKTVGGHGATKESLIWAGVIAFSEKGYSSIGLDEVLRSVNVPKGSFYYYFDSKDAFGAAVVDAYTSYFTRKLDLWFCDESVRPLQRLRNFAGDAQAGMARHDFKRGCVVGNLAQEMGALPKSFRKQIRNVFADWEARLSRLLKAAQAEGEIGPDRDCDRLSAFFWIGWEGAVLRAKLEHSGAALDLFADTFLQQIDRCAVPTQGI